MPEIETSFNNQKEQNPENLSIKLEEVSKIYSMGEVEVTALKDVSLEVSKGELIVFLGPSGSGKTTLLNIVGGLDTPTSGTVMVNGVDVGSLNEKQLTDYRRTQIGFIFQYFNLIPTLTAIENVELAAELVNSPLSPEGLLEEVGLRERMNHFPAELSGGENQRVAIARALASDPDLILCDEPTGSIDSETGKRIFKLLRDLNAKKEKSIIIVTHNSPIGAIANRVVRLRDGTISEIKENSSPMDPEKLEW